MSPRIILKDERCMYAEVEQHYSGRGFLIRAVVCRHPENEACVCLLESGTTCALCVEQEEEDEDAKQKANG